MQCLNKRKKLIMLVIKSIILFVTTIILLLSVSYLGFVSNVKGQESHYVPLKKILIVQHQYLSVYRDIYLGYMRTLPPEKYVITLYNAENDLPALNTFALQIVNEQKYDLIVCLGTLSAKKIIHLEKKKPILISGLASPEYSGLMKYWEGTKLNYSGIEIKNQTYNGLKYIRDFLTFDSIGFIYIIDEPSHEGTLLELQKLGNDQGFKVFAAGVYNRDENQKKYPDDIMAGRINSALEKIVPYTKTFYVNLSKTWLDNFNVFKTSFEKNNILSIGDDVFIGSGLVIGVSSDNFSKGEKLANYTRKILEEKADPGTLKMDMIPTFNIKYDLEEAKIIKYNPDIRFLLNVLNVKTTLK